MFQKIIDHIEAFIIIIIALAVIYAGIANYLHPGQTDVLIPADSKLLRTFKIIALILFLSLLIDLGIILFKKPNNNQ